MLKHTHGENIVVLVPLAASRCLLSKQMQKITNDNAAEVNGTAVLYVYVCAERDKKIRKFMCVYVCVFCRRICRD